MHNYIIIFISCILNFKIQIQLQMLGSLLLLQLLLGFGTCQRYHSLATFYFRIGPNRSECPRVQTFQNNMSYGPCNFGKRLGVKYNKSSKYWVAIKNAKSFCGRNIIVKHNTRSIILKIMDECPSCIQNRIDMSLDALIELTGSKQKACAINRRLPRISWNFI